MGKRSDFPRKPRDLYPTPAKAVLPLLPHLPMAYGQSLAFVEPCAGERDLVRHLEATSTADILCIADHDITDHRPVDARSASYDIPSGGMFITNPPWSRDILHPIIENLTRQAPTWLLIDADWAHTLQAIPYLTRCARIVAIGRVSWEGNGVSGKDNCCWYLFDRRHIGETRFYPRLHPSHCQGE